MQKTILIILIVFLSILISCQEKNKEVKTLSSKIESETDARLEAEIKNNTIYPVYDLANNTTAIVITMFESDSASKYEEIYKRINERDSLEDGFYRHLSPKDTKFEYYDTTGIAKSSKVKT